MGRRFYEHCILLRFHSIFNTLSAKDGCILLWVYYAASKDCWHVFFEIHVALMVNAWSFLQYLWHEVLCIDGLVDKFQVWVPYKEVWLLIKQFPPNSIFQQVAARSSSFFFLSRNAKFWPIFPAFSNLTHSMVKFLLIVSEMSSMERGQDVAGETIGRISIYNIRLSVCFLQS